MLLGMGWDGIYCGYGVATALKIVSLISKLFFFPLLPMSLLLVSNLQFYIEITMGTSHHCIG